MKTTFFYISIIVSFLIACSGDSKNTMLDKQKHSHDQVSVSKYTCPMHPTVVQDGPGKCPVCGMDLVPQATPEGNSADLMLNDSQMKLANIITQKVSLKSIGQTVVVNAKLVVDQEETEVISSRAAGRIEKLFIKETGRAVRKGEPLYELYSELLLTLQREYLLAKEQYESLGNKETRYESFLKGAERKLLLYGLSSKQIEQLSNSKTVQQRITFLAPTAGVVTEINAAEGQYIAEGERMYKIENISKLWMEAELYPQETSLVKIGDKINIKISGHDSEPVEASVAFLSPEYRANTQITIMRAAILNPQMKFKPGMQAQVLFTHSTKMSLAIPVDAVIRNGKGTHVYLQTSNNTFQPRFVKTGMEDFNQVEITEGLKENDVVAVSGAYLLYSELILKKGTEPKPGHNH